MKTEIQNIISQALSALVAQNAELSDASVSSNDIFVEHSQKKEFGDYSTNIAMKLAQKLKKNPKEIAEQILSILQKDTYSQFEKITVSDPGFVNFFLSEQWLCEQVNNIIAHYALSKKPLFSNLGQNKTVVIDFSSPNIAKPMSVGHLRATIIGDSLRRIYRSLGYNVIADNHLGDWGTQFGILIYAYKNYGDEKKVKKDPIKELNKLYVEFHRMMGERPALKRKGKEEFRKLEQGDPENRKIWEWFKEISMGEFRESYKLLGIEPFDYELGESFYEEAMQIDIEELKSKNITTQRKDGSLDVDLEKYGLGRFIVVKSDGATTYGTRDLATFRYRQEHFHFDKNLYVVGVDQHHHFRQLFKVLELMGNRDVDRAVHVSFGMIRSESGEKMSTRKGNVVTANDMISRSISEALQIIKEKNPKLENKQHVAQQVGIGALKYVHLFQNRSTNTSFHWDKMICFDGNTGPYLQYTNARIQSILRKKQAPRQADTSLLTNKQEVLLLRHLYQLPESVERAAVEFAPNVVADYLHTLASLFNEYYNNIPVLKAPTDTRNARLRLIQAIGFCFQQGLYILGIEAPEKM